MPTDPARRIVEEVLEKDGDLRSAERGSRQELDAWEAAYSLNTLAAPKLARMLKVALDALEEIGGNTHCDVCGEPVPSGSNASDAIAEINRIAEED